MPHTVHTVEELRNLVEVVTKAGEFAFDVESRGVLERHDDLHKLFLKECKEHIATLKNPGESIVASSTETIRSRYMKQLALDPLRNEVFWISIATLGHSFHTLR